MGNASSTRGNHLTESNMVVSYLFLGGDSILIEGLPPEYDYENTINRGTSTLPQPQLKFHGVHGTNVQLLRDGRIARRKESFCKGLAFSNR